MALRITQHDTFAIPVWAMVVDALETHLADLARDAATLPVTERATAGLVPRRNTRAVHGPHWEAWRATAIAVTDRLAEASSIGWRDRTVGDWAVVFSSAAEVGEEWSSLESHGRATFTAALWLEAPEPSEHAALALVLRNPYNALTKRYLLPTYAHHQASRLSMVVYPSFLEQFFEARGSSVWSSPGVLLMADIHYY